MPLLSPLFPEGTTPFHLQFEVLKHCLIGERWLNQAGFGDDLMNTLIVRFDRDVFDNLKVEGDPHTARFALGMC